MLHNAVQCCNVRVWWAWQHLLMTCEGAELAMRHHICCLCALSTLPVCQVCIFAYGQTGSGKTYTMLGNDDNRGIIPRAMAQVGAAHEQRLWAHHTYTSMKGHSLHVHAAGDWQLDFHNQLHWRLRIQQDILMVT